MSLIDKLSKRARIGLGAIILGVSAIVGNASFAQETRTLWPDIKYEIDDVSEDSDNNLCVHVKESLSHGSAKGIPTYCTTPRTEKPVTDDKGIAKFPLRSLTLGIYASSSEEGLKKILPSVPIISALKPEVRNEVLEDIAKKAVEYRLVYFEFGTLGEKINENGAIRNVKNTTKSWGIGLHNLREKSPGDPGKGEKASAVGIIRENITKKINSNIGTLEFVVKDDESHADIGGAKFRLKVTAPSKSSLVNQYFSNEPDEDYLRRIVPGIRNYALGDVESEQRSFKIYVPSEVEFEVVREGYKFSSGKIRVDKLRTKKEIFLTEKSNRVITKIEKEE